MNDINQFEFKLAKKNDIKPIFECVNEAYRVEKEHPIFGFKRCDRLADQSIVEDQLAVGTYLCCVDKKHTTLMGVIYYQIINHYAEVGPIAVFPRYQKKGLGTHLLVHVETICKQKQCVEINMNVVSTRLDLLDFYEKMGYLRQAETISPQSIGLESDDLTKDVCVLRYRKCLQ